MTSHACAACAKSSVAASICSRCKRVWYCDRECQRAHWKAHKAACVEAPSAAAAVAAAINAPAPSAAASSKQAASKASAQNAEQEEDESVIPTGPSVRASAAVSESLESLLGGGGASAKPSKSSASASSSSSSAAPAAAPVVVTLSAPASLCATHPLLEVRELPGRGRGFVAKQDIEPGTLLLTERAAYAHAAHCSSNEEARVAALVAITACMLERFPAALAELCHHPDHELPEHALISTVPAALSAAGVTTEQWTAALARVDSNQFSSARGMMCSPAISVANHACYPNADVIIREVDDTEAGDSAAAAAPAAAASSSSSPATSRKVEQCYLYSVDAIPAGSEVLINYLGGDSLCRWYAPACIRQESFEAQWQFRCDCLRCDVGKSKAKAIDKALSYTPQGMSEELEERYTSLVLDDRSAPSPSQLLKLYRDLYAQFDGERFSHHYLLHQIRAMLLFMPAAFDYDAPPATKAAPAKKGAGAGAAAKASKAPAADPALSGEAQWLQLVEHHLLTLRANLLNPALHSIKADSMDVMLRSTESIASAKAARAKPALSAEATKAAVVALQKRVVTLADEWDEVYEDPVWQRLYPDVAASMQALRDPPAAANAS